MKKSILIILSSLFFSLSCNDEKETADTNRIDYEQLAFKLSNDLNEIASDLRLNGADFSNTEQLKKSALIVLQNNYSNDQFAINEFNNGFEIATNLSGVISNGRKFEEEILMPEYQYRVIEKVDSLWFNALNFESYKSSLSELFETISTEEAPEADKQSALIYLTSQIVALDFIAANLDLLGYSGLENGRTHGWWDYWGKCAAGITGGAITGAGTLGLAGLGVGSIVPVGRNCYSRNYWCNCRGYWRWPSEPSCPRPNCPQYQCDCA